MQQTPSRTFSVSCLRQQQSAAAVRSEEEDNRATQASSTETEFQDLINSAMEPSPSTTQPQSLARQRNRQRNVSSPDVQQSTRSNHMKRPSAEVLDDLLNSTTSNSSQPKIDLSSLFSSTSTFSPQRTGPPPPPPPPSAAPMRLNSSLGRTITVNPERGMDVGRAFRALEMRCSQNQVRRQYVLQRFHERPGLKRKRLKSERWRRRFKENFRETVKMVQKMRKQGW